MQTQQNPANGLIRLTFNDPYSPMDALRILSESCEVGKLEKAHQETFTVVTRALSDLGLQDIQTFVNIRAYNVFLHVLDEMHIPNLNAYLLSPEEMFNLVHAEYANMCLLAVGKAITNPEDLNRTRHFCFALHIAGSHIAHHLSKSRRDGVGFSVF